MLESPREETLGGALARVDVNSGSLIMGAGQTPLDRSPSFAISRQTGSGFSCADPAEMPENASPSANKMRSRHPGNCGFEGFRVVSAIVPTP